MVESHTGNSGPQDPPDPLRDSVSQVATTLVGASGEDICPDVPTPASPSAPAWPRRREVAYRRRAKGFAPLSRPRRSILT